MKYSRVRDIFQACKKRTLNSSKWFQEKKKEKVKIVIRNNFVYKTGKISRG